ncbi:MAG: 4Fe-4S binding protein [Candidatus Bathyarchaeia archaeon]|jgi:Ni,Fe-hydrogenase III small subunit/ferredoxin/ribosomal protein L32|nr:4Fe-4S binding protein [Candidatus Bathyarchaeota archaeon A05DMB-4]MDH7594998.1 4Fe-4S binding protein [Candidatus Bathyarchaeota archaeon]
MAQPKISVYRFMAAGCNGCDVQILECLVPRYKLADLGVGVVFTPEEANVLAVTGGVNIKTMEELKSIYEKLQPPKLVVAVGNCALTKEIFDKGYSMVGPPDKIIPVNFYISGCPPRPQAIVTSIAKALGAKLEEKEDYWATPEEYRGRHEFDSEKCIGCGACAQVCSSDAIELTENNGKRTVKVDYGHCSYCAFCQDECPEDAIKLTREYHLVFTDRKQASVTTDVDMQKCSSCGAYFMPQRQLKRALERTEEKVAEYKRYHDYLKETIGVCLSCRRKISNIKKAKQLLSRLSVTALQK